MQEALENVAKIVNECLGPLGSEGFTWNTLRDFLIQIASTIVLFLVVKFFFWNKITAILEERRSLMDKELDEAKKIRESAILIENERNEELIKAQEKVKVMISQAEKESNIIRETIVNDAKEEAKRRLANSSAQIEHEIQEKNNEVRKLIVDVAFLVASKIVSEEIDQDKYMSVVNEIIEGAAK